MNDTDIIRLEKEIEEYGVGEGDDSGGLEDMMLIMVARNHIPKGEYLIDCSW